MEDNGCHYISTGNEDLSNWLRFVRPAQNIVEQNLVVHQVGQSLYFFVKRDIKQGEELLFWFSKEYAVICGNYLFIFLYRYLSCIVMQYLYAYWLVGRCVLYGSSACINVLYACLKIAVYREIFGPFYFCPFCPNGLWVNLRVEEFFILLFLNKINKHVWANIRLCEIIYWCKIVKKIYWAKITLYTDI